jgi:uncharacterized protein
VVKVQQRVQVAVLSVDLERKRISLSMKKEADKRAEGESKKEGKEKKAKHQVSKDKRESGPFNDAFAQAFRRQKR